MTLKNSILSCHECFLYHSLSQWFPASPLIHLQAIDLLKFKVEIFRTMSQDKAFYFKSLLSQIFCYSGQSWLAWLVCLRTHWNCTKWYGRINLKFQGTDYQMEKTYMLLWKQFPSYRQSMSLQRFGNTVYFAVPSSLGDTGHTPSGEKHYAHKILQRRQRKME